MKTDTLCREALCDRSVAERPRYYARQLITPDDMTLEQEYFRNKLRMHNRMLHGWGVVCGAQVCLVPRVNGSNGDSFEPWKVVVRPGYILGPYGDEIYIDCHRVVDLRSGGVAGVTGDTCLEASDPWCSEVVERRGEGPFYVAVKYKEFPARPVRVQPLGCGCDDTRCEYSRWRDGYEICVLDYCPDSHRTPPELDEVAKGAVPACPPCPEEPWVVLAEVHIDAGGKVTKIDNCACRRLVLTFGDFWWRCQPEAPVEPGEEPAEEVEMRIDAVQPVEIEADPVNRREHEINIKGQGFTAVKSISFGEGVLVRNFKVPSDGEIVVVAVIEPGAPAGPRKLIVEGARGRAEMDKAITIKQPGRPPGPTEPRPAEPRPRKRRKSGAKQEDE